MKSKVYGALVLMFAGVGAVTLAWGDSGRLLPAYRPRERNVYALYPSRRFLDAKVRTWVDFLKAELPRLFAEHEAVMSDLRHWA